jgi:hypothetical protein
MTRETVRMETSANLATSSIVAFLLNIVAESSLAKVVN